MPELELKRKGSTVSARLALALVAVSSACTYYLGFERNSPEPARQVFAKPSEPIPGGVKAAVVPVSPDSAKPKQKLAKGDRVLAVGSISIKPKAGEGCSCDEAVVDYTATVGKDGQPALYVTSKDADVSDAVLTPQFSYAAPPKLPAVLAVGTDGRGASVLYGRDVGPFWVAGQATYDPANGAGGFIHFGLRLR